MVSPMYILVLFCIALSLDLFSCVSDSVCDLFGEIIRHIFGCGGYFVERYGSV